MKLPSLVDYQEAVQAPSASFIDPTLRGGRPRLTPLRSPAVASGGFALTFDLTTNGERFAVRCFHKPGSRLEERYAEIANFIRAKRSGMNFLIDVKYVAAGIRVHGTVFPIVRMPWVQGLTLSEWVEDHLDRPQALEAVRHQIQEAVKRLSQERAAHCDLQHGNILIDSRNNIHLVDYDGMYLRSLHHLGAAESGHRNYQHPGRGASYDHQLDAFAAFVIDLSLSAVIRDRTLWDEFHTGENLLFSADDYASPERSSVFRRLSRLSSLSEQVRRLRDACAVDFASAPAVLAGTRPATSTRHRASPAERRRPTGPAPVLAHDRSALLTRVGDEITVIGRVTGTRPLVTKTGKPMTFINFGDYRRGDFTIVAFDRATRELQSTFGTDLRALPQSWVSINGLLTLYQSKWSASPTPQIELRRARSLRLLEPNQVETLIAHAGEHREPIAVHPRPHRGRRSHPPFEPHGPADRCRWPTQPMISTSASAPSTPHLDSPGSPLPGEHHHHHRPRVPSYARRVGGIGCDAGSGYEFVAWP